MIEAFYSAFVAPLVGAWIEISRYLFTMSFRHVAPLVGAWIEIWYLNGWYHDNAGSLLL